MEGGGGAAKAKAKAKPRQASLAFAEFVRACERVCCVPLATLSPLEAACAKAQNDSHTPGLDPKPYNLKPETLQP